jgi:DNA-binding NarL/FixJ family response regulator
MLARPERTKVVRVIIVERHALFGKALNHILSSQGDFEVICDVDSINAAPLRTSRPDLIVLDFDGHNVEIGQTMRVCRESAPQARVCVLSAHVVPEVMQRCLAAGADAFIVKDVSPNELVHALTMVSNGVPYVDPRIAGGLLRRRPAGVGRGSNHNTLSARETEIIRLIAQGLSNKEIGVALGLSEKTVKNNISRIFSKLNINARTQAAVHAIKTGLV